MLYYQIKIILLTIIFFILVTRLIPKVGLFKHTWSVVERKLTTKSVVILVCWGLIFSTWQIVAGVDTLRKLSKGVDAQTYDELVIFSKVHKTDVDNLLIDRLYSIEMNINIEDFKKIEVFALQKKLNAKTLMNEFGKGLQDGFKSLDDFLIAKENGYNRYAAWKMEKDAFSQKLADINKEFEDASLVFSPDPIEGLQLICELNQKTAFKLQELKKTPVYNTFPKTNQTFVVLANQIKKIDDNIQNTCAFREKILASDKKITDEARKKRADQLVKCGVNDKTMLLVDDIEIAAELNDYPKACQKTEDVLATLKRCDIFMEDAKREMFKNLKLKEKGRRYCQCSTAGNC